MSNTAAGESDRHWPNLLSRFLGRVSILPRSFAKAPRCSLADPPPGLSQSLIHRPSLAPIRRVLALILAVPLTGFCQRLTPLSSPPDWHQLNRFQETITRDEFADLLDSVYAPNNAGGNGSNWKPLEAIIQENASDRFVLRFASARHQQNGAALLDGGREFQSEQ